MSLNMTPNTGSTMEDLRETYGVISVEREGYAEVRVIADPFNAVTKTAEKLGLELVGQSRDRVAKKVEYRYKA